MRAAAARPLAWYNEVWRALQQRRVPPPTPPPTPSGSGGRDESTAVGHNYIGHNCIGDGGVRDESTAVLCIAGWLALLPLFS